MSPVAGCRWAICISARAMARSPSAARSRWPAGCTSRSTSSRTASPRIRHQESRVQTVADHAELQGLPDLRGHLGRRGRQAALPRRSHRLPSGLPERDQYLKKFGYSGAQAYSILGTAPCQGHISGWWTCRTPAALWLPTEIFDFDISPAVVGRTDQTHQGRESDADLPRQMMRQSSLRGMRDGASLAAPHPAVVKYVAFSSEVGASSREENASKIDTDRARKPNARLRISS